MTYNDVRRLAAVGACYLVVTGFMTLPAVLMLRTHLIGLGGDPWQTLWRLEYTQRQLGENLRADGGRLLVREFLGGGPARLVNLSAWPWLWLQAAVGEPLAYNLIWLSTYVVSGLGMYGLVRWLIRESGIAAPARTPGGVLIREGPAFLAGLVYMFLPYHAAQSQGHFGAMQIQWLPLLLWLTLALKVRPTYGKAAGLGVLFALQAWTEHHYALWLGIFLVGGTLFAWRRVRTHWRRFVGPAAVFGLLLVALTVVPYWPTVRLALQPATPLDLGEMQLLRFSADLFSYAVPAPFHPVWGGLSQLFFHQHFTGNVSEATHYVGLVPLLLVLFFHGRLPQRTKRFWLAAAVVFAMISLGPRLHLVGRVTPVPLPWALVDGWPVFSAVRVVARASVMTGAALAVLLGLVAAVHVRRAYNLVLIGTAVLLEFLFFPVPVQTAQLPAVYRAVRELPGERLLEIPAATNYQTASRALYGSLQHGKEVVGNIALERAEGTASAEVRSLPMLRQLLYLRTTHVLQEREEFLHQEPVETFADVAAYLDLGAVVIHPDSLSSVQLSALRHFFEQQAGLSARVVDDAWLYPWPAALSGDGVFAARDERWRVGNDRASGLTFATLSGEAGLNLYNVRSEPVLVQLTWRSGAASLGTLKLDVLVPHENQTSESSGTRAVSMTLPPGRTEVLFRHVGGGEFVLEDPRLQVLSGSE